MFNKKSIAIFGLLMGVFLVSGCINQGRPTTPTPTEQVQAAGEVKEFSVLSFNFGYDPATINVNEGDTVKITIDNRDTTHIFTINELDVNERLVGGETKTIEFIASKKGTFGIYCAVPGHKSAGMEGQIIVS